MQVAREQLERVKTYAATWAHPDGVAYKTLGTLTIPGTAGAVMVHVKGRMKLAGTATAMEVERTLPIVIDDTGGPIVFNCVGIGALPSVPGETVSYSADLAAADLQFAIAVAGANVSVEVQMRWPALVGGQSLEVAVELWWE